jgi:DNA replication and repair protein RecF
MTLEQIELLDFRIFTAAAFVPESEGTTVITGPNGTGKTSVLEAMVYLGTQRSFRGRNRGGGSQPDPGQPQSGPCP